MANKNYLIRPEASPKAAPVKKKDIQESLQEANETADKLLERMTEMTSKYNTMMATGITSRLDNRATSLFNTVLAETKAMPRGGESGGKSIKDRDGQGYDTDGREDVRDQDALHYYHPFPQWTAGDGCADDEVKKLSFASLIIISQHFQTFQNVLFDIFITHNDRF